MALTERLALLVSLDSQGAIRGFEKIGQSADRNLSRAESKIDRTAKHMQRAGVGMLGVATLAATGLYKAGQSASDLEQAVGGTEAVFHETAGTIDRFAKGAARNMGLSERAFREATTSLGGQLKGLGFSLDDAADKSVDLTGVAADLAATYGGTTAEAVQALGAAFRGEADPAERFNLFLNQNRVNAKAVEMGLAATTSQVDAHAKAQATLALITEQSADAQGQFAREAGTAAGQMQIANAEFENAKAALGESVAPIIADVAGGLGKLAGGFAAADEASNGLVSKLATFGTLGLGAAGGLSFIIGQAIEAKQRFGELGSGLGKIRSSISGLSPTVKGLGGLFGVAAVGVVAFVDSMNDVEEEAKNLRDEAEAAGKSLEDTFKDRVSDVITENKSLRGSLKDAGVGFDEVVDAITGSDAAFRDFTQSLVGSVPDKHIGKLVELRNGYLEAGEQAKVAAGHTEELGGANKDAAGSADKNAGSVEGLTKKLNEQEEALQGVLDATLAQFDSNLGYRRSVDEVEGSLADLLETQKEHGRNSEEYRDALMDTEGALLDQAAAAVRVYEDTVKAAGGTLSAKDKTNIYRSELSKLRDSLAPGSPLRQVLQGYIDQLGRIPSTIKTTASFVRPTGGFDRFGAATGGLVPNYLATGGRPRGTDTIPAMLTPGEFVMKRSAVDRIGLGTLAAMNAGAASRPAGGDTIVVQVGDREVARLYADGKVRADRRGVHS